MHAHWLAAGAVALTLRKPYVVQVWGTDVELARRVPWLVRPVLRRARLVIAASPSLADAARALGARDVRVVPSGVAIPESVGAPEEPPHVLYVGRLSAEKGVLELVEAARGLPLRVVGDGPLRAQVPGAVGFVPPGELGPWYERAAVVVGAVAPRGLRRRRARGDGVGEAGRRDRGRRAASTRSTTARPGCSCRPATSPRCARRSSGCSATRSCVRGSARRRGRRRSASSRSTLRRTRSSRVYEEALA